MGSRGAEVPEAEVAEAEVEVAEAEVVGIAEGEGGKEEEAEGGGAWEEGITGSGAAAGAEEEVRAVVAHAAPERAGRAEAAAADRVSRRQ